MLRTLSLIGLLLAASLARGETLALGELLAGLDDSALARAGRAEQDALDALKRQREAEAGWQWFASAGTGHYRELVTEDLEQVLRAVPPERELAILDAIDAGTTVLEPLDCDLLIRSFAPDEVPAMLLRDRLDQARVALAPVQHEPRGIGAQALQFDARAAPVPADRLEMRHQPVPHTAVAVPFIHGHQVDPQRAGVRPRLGVHESDHLTVQTCDLEIRQLVAQPVAHVLLGLQREVVRHELADAGPVAHAGGLDHDLSFQRGGDRSCEGGHRRRVVGQGQRARHIGQQHDGFEICGTTEIDRMPS